MIGGADLQSSSGSEPTAGSSVLVVDDEDAVRDLLVHLVASLGYRVSSAGNGRDALEMVEADPPDVILTDLMMPFMSGVRLAAVIRKRATERGVAPPKILLLTASGAPTAETVGADVVLQKPFDLDDVEAALLALKQP